jgi:hypothetical protein
MLNEFQINPECRDCLKKMARAIHMMDRPLNDTKIIILTFYKTLGVEPPKRCTHYVEKIVTMEDIAKMESEKISYEAHRLTVYLCGSMRYSRHEFEDAEFALSALGYVVLSHGIDYDTQYKKVKYSANAIAKLNYDKINMSQIIYVMNNHRYDLNSSLPIYSDFISPYVGKEIALARHLDKEVWWLNEHKCSSVCNCQRGFELEG